MGNFLYTNLIKKVTNKLIHCDENFSPGINMTKPFSTLHRTNIINTNLLEYSLKVIMMLIRADKIYLSTLIG